MRAEQKHPDARPQVAVAQQRTKQSPGRPTATTTVLPRPRAVLQRAQADPSSLNAAEVYVLQRTIGLRAAQRMLSTPLPPSTLVQPKLTVGPVGDKYEQEADRTAKQVMRSLDAPAVQREENAAATAQSAPPINSLESLQRNGMMRVAREYSAALAQRRQSGEGRLQAKPLAGGVSRIQRQEMEDEEKLQAKPLHGLEGGEVDPGVAATIGGAKGGGQPLHGGVRASMERGFGADFSGVRVHTGQQADMLNRSLSSSAFTTGRDIFFRRGEYNPGNSAGKELIAHELTHVVQQGGGQPDQVQTGAGVTVQRKLKFGVGDLEGYVSTKAGLKGQFGMESTYSKIDKALTKYWRADTAEERLILLRTLATLSQKWLANFEKQKAPSKLDWEKMFSIKKLEAAARVELKDEEFKAKFGMGSADPDVTNSLLDGGAGATYYAFARLAKKQLKRGEKTKDAVNKVDMSMLERYESVKALGLSQSEIFALTGYTGDQYRFINPAMAGNKSWLEANMKGKGKETSPGKVDTAMEANQEIAGYASAGLSKLPAWKQDRKLYRGETFPQAEGEAFGPGVEKKYPHFVSTSQEKQTPLAEIGRNVSPERPYRVLFHITKTYRPGKDVSSVSQMGTGEAEILFPAGTTLAVTKTLKHDKTANSKEVEVVTK